MSRGKALLEFEEPPPPGNAEGARPYMARQQLECGGQQEFWLPVFVPEPALA